MRQRRLERDSEQVRRTVLDLVVDDSVTMWRASLIFATGLPRGHRNCARMRCVAYASMPTLLMEISSEWMVSADAEDSGKRSAARCAGDCVTSLAGSFNELIRSRLCVI